MSFEIIFGGKTVRVALMKNSRLAPEDRGSLFASRINYKPNAVALCDSKYFIIFIEYVYANE